MAKSIIVTMIDEVGNEGFIVLHQSKQKQETDDKIMKYIKVSIITTTYDTSTSDIAARFSLL